MSIDETRIIARVHGRSVARDLLSLADPEKLIEPAREAFWIAIRDEALKHAPLPIVELPRATVKPMSDREAREFEKITLEFGKYIGTSIGQILEHDRGYLDWLAGWQDQFKMQLNRYLLFMNTQEPNSANP